MSPELNLQQFNPSEALLKFTENRHKHRPYI